jgi:hypothetical protein
MNMSCHGLTFGVKRLKRFKFGVLRSAVSGARLMYGGLITPQTRRETN